MSECDVPFCVSDHDNPLEVGHRITSQEGVRHHYPDIPAFGSVTEVTIIDGPIRSITAGEHAELIGWLKANPLEPRRS